MDQFLLYGDSITQYSFAQDLGFGFGAALSTAYVRSLDVVNRGLSGYNSRLALKLLPDIMPSPQRTTLRFMTFWFGANDARLPNTFRDPQQHVPLEEYKSNLRAMLTHPLVRAHEGVRLILITPPPIDERMSLQGIRQMMPDYADGPPRTASVTAQYAQAVRDVGEELNVAVLDVWSGMMSRATGTAEHAGLLTPGALHAAQNTTLQSFLRDGLHLSAAGNKVVFEELQALIERVWPDQAPDKLKWVYPGWADEGAWLARDAS